MSALFSGNTRATCGCVGLRYRAVLQGTHLLLRMAYHAHMICARVYRYTLISLVVNHSLRILSRCQSDLPALSLRACIS
jgi:hypothetical protein